MSESKHTPGVWKPWKSPEGLWTVRATYEDGKGRRCTAWPAVCNAGAQDNAANAALISAAPDMLEALLMQVRNCPVCKGTRKAVDVFDMLTSDGPHEETECKRCAPGWAAIAKATGEPVELREAS